MAFHPRLMFNGEGDCVATKLRPGNVQCRELGRTLARSGPLGGPDKVRWRLPPIAGGLR